VRRPAGFTIIEMIVVLLLMSIIAAAVIGRSVTTTDLDLTAQTDKLRNHLRYAQSMAMKRADTEWGIRIEAGRYWLFRGTDPGIAANQIKLPGVDYSGSDPKVTVPSGLSLSTTLGGGLVYFNRLGKPHHQSEPAALSTPQTVTVSASTENRTIAIEPETGLIR
jgi:prepilin-type N-terminal cleavage/methylation domain-containing protein